MIQGWNLTRAIRNSGCQEVEFDAARNKESRGYTVFNDIALSPLITERNFVGVHELAHAVLAHSKHSEQEINRLIGTEKERHTNKFATILNTLRHEDELDHLTNLHEIEAHTIALLVARILQFTDYDMVDEEKYLAYYMGEVADGGTDPVAFLEEGKDRILKTAVMICENGFISPARGQAVISQALRG
jgi:hypothetical protein